MDIRNGWSGDQVYYQDEAGHQRSMPITWTSLIAVDPVVEFGGGRSAFKLADLLELVRLIEAVRAQWLMAGIFATAGGCDETEGRRLLYRAELNGGAEPD